MQRTTKSLWFAPFSFGPNGKREEVRMTVVIYEFCFEMSLLVGVNEFRVIFERSEYSRLIEKYSSYLFARKTHACWGRWMHKTKTIGIPPYLYFRVIVEGKLNVWFECRKLVHFSIQEICVFVFLLT